MWFASRNTNTLDLPAAAFLKRALPDAHISWAVERRASAILKDSPAIDELIEIDTRGLRKNLFSGATLESFKAQLGNLRGNDSTRRFDVAIDFQGLMKIAVEYADVVLKRSDVYSPQLNELLASIPNEDNKRLAEINHENEDWVENYMTIYQDLVS